VKLDPEVWRPVFPELVGPDDTQTRPILGFRINRVQLVRRWLGKPSVVLRGMGPSGYSWEAGRNEAVCWFPGKRHLAPATNCSCGFYAVHDVDRLSWVTHLDADNFVLAGVAGTGIVRVHTDGWRAQFARIVAFCVELPEISAPRSVLIDGHQLTLEQVLKMFGIVPKRIRRIETKGIRKGRHPSRSTEAQGRLSAAVAEALEAQYQVPVVPLDELKAVMAGAGNFLEEMR
jgi:hypothetical protein